MSSAKGSITTSNLLNELVKTIDTFGEQRTIEILQTEREKDESQKHISFVINMVCEQFGITPEQVSTYQWRDKKNRTNKSILAIKFISYYSYEFFNETGVGYQDIGRRLNRKHGIVLKHHHDMRINRKNNTTENEYNLNCFKHFDVKVKKYLKTITHKK